MNQPPTTIPIAFVHSMLHGVRARNMSEQSFLHEAGIPPQLLTQAGARVTVEQYVALFKHVVDRLDDDVLGLQSRPVRRGSFALIARSALSAPNLEVAIRRCTRTYRLLQDDVLAETVHDGTLVGLQLRFVDSERTWPIFLHELLLRVFWRLLAWLAGGKLPIARFDLGFPRPAYTDSYRRVFPAPLAFDCAHSAFWFDARLMPQRIRQDEVSLFKFLANAQANIIVPPRNTDTVSASVRSHFQRTHPQWPDVAITASALNMSSATLQRRLAAEGTSFQVLKDTARRDLAIVRLASSDIALPSLASELGFSDAASFQRAFKDWTGSAPGAYRRDAKLWPLSDQPHNSA